MKRTRSLYSVSGSYQSNTECIYLNYVRYSYHDDDAKLMATMGYNVIRLGVLWAGLEPEEGQYNMTYLDQVVECVNTAEKYGLGVVLDMHQDAFNRWLQVLRSQHILIIAITGIHFHFKSPSFSLTSID